MTEETPTAEWLLTMAQDIEDSDGVATVMKRGDPSVKKIKPEYYGDMIISTPLMAADLVWALRRAASTLDPSGCKEGIGGPREDMPGYTQYTDYRP